MTKYVEEKSSGDESDDACYMMQGNDSLEVNSDTQLDDASSSCDDYMDADALNEELSIVCENILETVSYTHLTLPTIYSV